MRFARAMPVRWVDPGCPGYADVASRAHHRRRHGRARDRWVSDPREMPRQSAGQPTPMSVRCYRIVDEPPSAVAQDDQSIEQPEADRGHDKQIAGSDAVGLVAQERLPALTRSLGTFDHVLGNSRLGDLDAEPEQLAVDPGPAPKPI